MSRIPPLIYIAAVSLISDCGQICGQESTVEARNVVSAKKTPPAEYLDALGKTAKARWRLYFRPPPPTPPVDRTKAALILGSLIAESHLIWQANDSQQFRNNNQDLITYCRMMGVGTEIMPRLMAQGKMAEEEKWKDLRTEISLTQSEICRLLQEMQDDDLARLIDAGLWLRVLEVSTAIGKEAPAEIAPDVFLSSESAASELRSHLSTVSVKMKESKPLQELQRLVDGITTPSEKNGDSIHTLMQSLLDHDK